MASSTRQVTLEWSNLTQVKKALDAYADDRLHRASRALFREAERIITTSKNAFVPVDTGALRASGYVKPPEIAGLSLIVVEFGFGGAAVPYALIVHELQGVYHRVGQSKYLEVPVRAALTGMDERLAADIRRG